MGKMNICKEKKAVECWNRMYSAEERLVAVMSLKPLPLLP